MNSDLVATKSNRVLASCMASFGYTTSYLLVFVLNLLNINEEETMNQKLLLYLLLICKILFLFFKLFIFVAAKSKVSQNFYIFAIFTFHSWLLSYLSMANFVIMHHENNQGVCSYMFFFIAVQEQAVARNTKFSKVLSCLFLFIFLILTCIGFLISSSDENSFIDTMSLVSLAAPLIQEALKNRKKASRKFQAIFLTPESSDIFPIKPEKKPSSTKYSKQTTTVAPHPKTNVFSPIRNISGDPVNFFEKQSCDELFSVGSKVSLNQFSFGSFASLLPFPTVIINIKTNTAVSANKEFYDMFFRGEYEVKTERNLDEIDSKIGPLFQITELAEKKKEILISELVSKINSHEINEKSFPAVFLVRKATNLATSLSNATLAQGSSRTIEVWLQYFKGKDGESFLGIQFKESGNQQEIMKLREEIMNSFSHEFNTPLNLINTTFSMLLKEEGLSQDFKNTILKPAYFANKLLRHIVGGMHDHASIISGDYTLKVRSRRIQEVFDKIIKMFKHKATEQNITISVEIDEGLPEKWSTDWVLVTRILVELITNALKFTLHGEIRIRCFKLLSDELGFGVHDTGIGMNEMELHRLENYLRSNFIETKISRNSSGIGIGMVAIRSMIQLLNQKHAALSVFSQEGKGSQFEFNLINLSSQNNEFQTSFYEAFRVIMGSNLSKTSMTQIKGQIKKNILNNDMSLSIDEGKSKIEEHFIDSRREREGSNDLSDDDVDSVIEDEDSDDSKEKEECNIGGKIKDYDQPPQHPWIIERKKTFNVFQCQNGQKNFKKKSRTLMKKKESIRSSYSLSQMSKSVTENGFILTCSCQRILIVDDEPANRLVLRLQLGKHELTKNVAIIEASNGEEGYKKFVEFSDPKNTCGRNCGVFWMIFMDINMPVMDGVRSCKLIRKHSEEKELQRQVVICYTAYNYEEKYKALGFDYLVSKPTSSGAINNLLSCFVKNF